MNDVINYLLILSVAGCISAGVYLLEISKFQVAYVWLAYYFMGLAVSQVVALPIGVLAGRYKQKEILSWYVIS